MELTMLTIAVNTVLNPAHLLLPSRAVVQGCCHVLLCARGGRAQGLVI